MAILQEATSSSARPDGGGGVGPRYRFGRLLSLPLGFALAVLLAWELLCRASRVSPVLLPPPSAVWSVLSGNWEILLQQSVPTTLETIASFAAATLLGVALAVAITPPAIIREGYRLLKDKDWHGSSELLQLLLPGLVGMAFSFVAGLLALKFLSAVLERGRWHYFGFYCLAMAVGVLAVWQMGF